MATMTARPATRTRVYPQSRETNVSRRNVGDLERWLSVLGGGALTAYGLARGGPGGVALTLLGGGLVYHGVNGHCSLYQALGLSTDRRHSPQASVPAAHGVKVEESITILRPREDLFRFWRHFQNLPRVMSHLESITTTGPNLFHWVARGPLGTRIEWDAEIHTERPHELISWRSLAGSVVDTAGSVHFTPAAQDRSTEVRVVLKYAAPGGKLGEALVRLFGEDPAAQVREGLQQLKRHMETGTVPGNVSQPAGGAS